MSVARSQHVACLALGLLLPLASMAHAADLPLLPGTVLRPASVEEGRRVLTARDAYIQAMLPHERRLLMGRADTPSEAEFLAFLGDQVVPWAEGEVAELEAAVGEVRDSLAALGLKLHLPKIVLLVRTLGMGLSGCPHTRAHAIMLPRGFADGDEEFLARVLVHELFHVWSRHNPAQRDALYRIIGFERCGAIPIPEELGPRQFTNPDAPRTEHVAEIDLGGERVHVALIPLFKDERPALGTPLGLGTSFSVEPLVVERRGGRWVPQRVDGRLRLLDIARVPGLFEKVGMNTSYLIQPEEILADNFMHLVAPSRPLLSPRIPEAIRELLQAPRGVPQAVEE